MQKYLNDRLSVIAIVSLAVFVLMAGILGVFHVRVAYAQTAQRTVEISRLDDTVLWRTWFVSEIQRHDVHMGLKPLPWPGKLIPIPGYPVTTTRGAETTTSTNGS